MSLTEDSGSELNLSVIIPSEHARMPDSGSEISRGQNNRRAIEISQRFYDHPFADKLSPFEEFKQNLIDFCERVMMMLFNGIWYVFKVIFALPYYLAVMAASGLGFLVEVLPAKIKKGLNKETKPFNKSASFGNLMEGNSASDLPLEIVLDLDQTLIHAI